MSQLLHCLEGKEREPSHPPRVRFALGLVCVALAGLALGCGDSPSGETRASRASQDAGTGTTADPGGDESDSGAAGEAVDEAGQTELDAGGMQAEQDAGIEADAGTGADAQVQAEADGSPGADASAQVDAGDAGTVDEAPSIFIISDVGTTPGKAFAPLMIHFYDEVTPGAELVVSAESSNQAFLPDAGLMFGAVVNEGSPGPGHSYRELTLTPSTLTTGSATVTVRVEDASGNSSARDFEVSILSAPLSSVEAVSVSGGAEPELGSLNSFSARPSLSADGKVIAFESNADNFGAGTSAYQDIYVRDRVLKTTTRITSGLGRSERPTISPDARFVAFYSTYGFLGTDTNAVADCYLFDRQTSTFERISVSSEEAQANGPSSPGPFEDSRPALSDDGRYVAFVSSASNLVAGDENGKVDVFVRDRLLQTTSRLSVSTSGAEGNADSGQPTMSADGSVLAFSSLATNLEDGVTDADTRLDVFIRTAGTTHRISRAHGTQQAANGLSDHPMLSADGSVLAFASAATNLGPSIEYYGHVDIWLYKLATQVFTRINTDLDPTGSQGYCSGPSLSQDGKRLVFSTQGYIGDFLSDGAQTYTYDATTGKLSMVSTNNVGSVPNAGTSYESVISRDGTQVAFQTAASDVVFGDANNNSDVFIVPF